MHLALLTFLALWAAGEASLAKSVHHDLRQLVHDFPSPPMLPDELKYLEAHPRAHPTAPPEFYDGGSPSPDVWPLNMSFPVISAATTTGLPSTTFPITSTAWFSSTTMMSTTTTAPWTTTPTPTTTLPQTTMGTAPPVPASMQAPFYVKAIGSPKFAEASKPNPELVEQLKKKKWTMIVGDSILLLQFLALANQIQPSCKKVQQEMISKEAINPLQFVTKETPEFAMICKKEGGCEFRHVNCYNFDVPNNCPSSEPIYCQVPRNRRCTMKEWKDLVDDIVSPETEYAVTYHWLAISAGRYAPDINQNETDPPLDRKEQQPILDRLHYAQGKIGAMVMDNCLHSYAAPMAHLSKSQFNYRLGLFRGIVAHNLDLFLSPEWGGFKGPVIFQGCPKLFCHLAANPALCKAHQDELIEVDQGLVATLKEHSSSNQLRFLDARQTLEELPPGVVYADDRHPCWIRTCSWDKSCQAQLTTELEQMQKAYEIAFGNLRVFTEWYSKETLRYEEFKGQVEKEAEEWRLMHNKQLKNYSTVPTKLQVKLSTAQQLLSQLILNKDVLNKLIGGVAEIQNSAPKPYDNNEAMCPELLSAWVKHLKQDVKGAPAASPAPKPALRGPAPPVAPAVPAPSQEEMAAFAPFDPSELPMDQPPAPSVAQPPAPGKKPKASAKSPKVSSLLRSGQHPKPATGGSLGMPVAEEWTGIAKRFDIPRPDAGETAAATAADHNSMPVALVLTTPPPISDEWSQIAGRMNEAAQSRFPVPAASLGIPTPSPLTMVTNMVSSM